MRFNRVLTRLFVQRPGGTRGGASSLQVQFKAPIAQKTEEKMKSLAALTSRLGPTNPEMQKSVLSSRTLKPNDALKMIESDFVTFFKEREMNTNNFNLLLKVLSAKRDFSEAENVFRRMEMLGIKQDLTTLATMVSAASKTGDLELVEKFYTEGVTRYGENKVLLSAMLQALSRTSQGPLPEEAEGYFRRGLAKGIVPDAAILTSLINVLGKAGKFDRVWELYHSRHKLGVKPDDVMLGLLMKICKNTKDSERAKYLFSEIKADPDVRLTCLHYNAYIAALSKRTDYADEAIAEFHKMLEKGIQPDSDTFAHVLLACANAKNIKEGFNALSLMKQFKILPNKYIVTKALEVYAEVIASPNVHKELRALYLKDSWNLFNMFTRSQVKYVNAEMLNSMLKVHASAESIVEAEELLLPLFERYKVQKNAQTYLIFLRAYKELNFLPKMRKLYEIIEHDPKLLCWDTLNLMTFTFMRLGDLRKVDETLDKLLAMKKGPSLWIAKRLLAIDFLPDTVYARLRLFENTKELFKNRERTVTGNDRESRDHAFQDMSKFVTEAGERYKR